MKSKILFLKWWKTTSESVSYITRVPKVNHLCGSSHYQLVRRKISMCLPGGCWSIGSSCLASRSFFSILTWWPHVGTFHLYRHLCDCPYYEHRTGSQGPPTALLCGLFCFHLYSIYNKLERHYSKKSEIIPNSITKRSKSPS